MYVCSVAFDQPSNIYQIVFDQMVEVFFWMDLTMNFLQEYTDQDNFQKVRLIRKLSKRYILQ